MGAWLDVYPDDFRCPPHYTALRRLREFVVDQLPDDIELQRRVTDRLQASLRRQDTVVVPAALNHRRPQSAGTQRQRAYFQSLH